MPRTVVRHARRQCFAVTNEAGYHILKNDAVVQLSSGRLVVPVSSTPNIDVPHFHAVAYYSDDHGLTWTKGSGIVDFDLTGRGPIEPEGVELRDGRVLMIMRTQLGHLATA